MNVDVYYSPTSLPMILASIHGLPQWPGYEMSEYTVNITISSNNSLLHQATVLNNENNTALFTLDQTCDFLSDSVYQNMTFPTHIYRRIGQNFC